MMETRSLIGRRRIPTTREAFIGALSINTAMAAFAVLILSEYHLLTGLMAALAAGLVVILTGIAWARRKKKDDATETGPENNGTSKLTRLLAGAGVFLLGTGETFLVGIVFFILADYFSAHHYPTQLLRFIDSYGIGLVFLIAAFFPAFNAWRRQWLLVLGNVLGPLLALGLIALLALAIMAGPGHV